MPPIAVRFVLDSHHVGGAEFAWLDLVERLDRSVVDPSFVCPSHPEYDAVASRATRAGVRCCGRVDVVRTLDLRGRLAFRRLLRGFQGVVHFNQNKLDSCRHQIGVARSIDGLRRVSTVHGFTDFEGKSPWRRIRCRRAFGALDHVFAVSTPLRDAVLALAPTTSVSVAPNFVPDSLLDRARRRRESSEALRKELALSSSDAVAVSVATVLGAKGQSALIDEMPRALARMPELRLVLVGRDVDGSAELLRARARDLSCSHALRVAGWRDDVLEVVAAADVLVHAPSSEGLGRVVQEAMAASLPVVSYAVGGVVDLVEPERTGHLVPAGDIEQLFDRMLLVLRDRVAAASLGRAGRERVEREFSESTVLRAHYEWYERIWSRPPRAT